MNAAGPYSAPQVPPGWEALWDPSSNRYYFLDLATKQTHWELPSSNGYPPAAMPNQANAGYGGGSPGGESASYGGDKGAYPSPSGNMQHQQQQQQQQQPVGEDGERGMGTKIVGTGAAAFLAYEGIKMLKNHNNNQGHNGGGGGILGGLLGGNKNNYQAPPAYGPPQYGQGHHNGGHNNGHHHGHHHGHNHSGGGW